GLLEQRRHGAAGGHQAGAAEPAGRPPGLQRPRPGQHDRPGTPLQPISVAGETGFPPSPLPQSGAGSRWEVATQTAGVNPASAVTSGIQSLLLWGGLGGGTAVFYLLGVHRRDSSTPPGGWS